MKKKMISLVVSFRVRKFARNVNSNAFYSSRHGA